eukprot:10314027-Alexandrium_andersonii.AAC.1
MLKSLTGCNPPPQARPSWKQLKRSIMDMGDNVVFKAVYDLGYPAHMNNPEHETMMLLAHAQKHGP